ncbi:MAG: phospholipase [Rhizobiales bacterium]|nr:phospholipase [Hyphomicrobiales bacterium]
MRRGRNGDRAATATPETAVVAEHPTIGLALGGGAARGFAHIGVLRTLAKHGIQPDVIVGTSIGAVVGGCHAAGQLDEFEEWCSRLNTRRLLGYLDVSFSGAGLIGGGRLANRLEKSIGRTVIEDLPIRFAAIATEVKTGHEIWLTRGLLVEAMRASYALPGIFPPVHVGGRWLVDGALVNPVPVSAARSLGARLVIAVNVNADQFDRGGTIPDIGVDIDDVAAIDDRGTLRNGLRTAERLLKRQFVGHRGRPGIPSVMVDAFNVMQDRITRSRLAGDPPDVTINPRLGQIGWFDFHRASEAIAAGAEATERAIETVQDAVATLV